MLRSYETGRGRGFVVWCVSQRAPSLLALRSLKAFTCGGRHERAELVSLALHELGVGLRVREGRTFPAERSIVLRRRRTPFLGGSFRDGLKTSTVERIPVCIASYETLEQLSP